MLPLLQDKTDFYKQCRDTYDASTAEVLNTAAIAFVLCDIDQDGRLSTDELSLLVNAGTDIERIKALAGSTVDDSGIDYAGFLQVTLGTERLTGDDFLQGLMRADADAKALDTAEAAAVAAKAAKAAAAQEEAAQEEAARKLQADEASRCQINNAMQPGPAASKKQTQPSEQAASCLGLQPRAQSACNSPTLRGHQLLVWPWGPGELGCGCPVAEAGPVAQATARGPNRRGLGGGGPGACARVAGHRLHARPGRWPG